MVVIHARLFLNLITYDGRLKTIAFSLFITTTMNTDGITTINVCVMYANVIRYGSMPYIPLHGVLCLLLASLLTSLPSQTDQHVRARTHIRGLLHEEVPLLTVCIYAY